MSNKKEAKYIKNKKYQHKTASGIAKGISLFIKQFNNTKGFVK
jgi:N-acetylmuramoyl-L-alanine amidase